EDKATAEQKALINKLAQEFAGELQGLGVRVQRLEDGAKRIVLQGNAMFRYDQETGKPAGSTAYANQKNMNLDLLATYNQGDGWAVTYESEWTRKYDDPSYSNAEMLSTQHEQQYITSGKHFMVGKHKYAPGYGLALNGSIQGVQYMIGDDNLAAILNMAHTSDTARINGTANAYADLRTAELVWAVNSNTHLRADYERVENVKNYTGYTKYSGIGGDTQFGDIKLIAAASKVDLDTDTNYDAKAYLAKIQFKEADKDVAHSSDLFIAYSKLPVANTLDQGDEYTTSTVSAHRDNYFTNFKGTQIGFHYVPMKNTLVTVWYMTGKTIEGDTTYGLAAGDNVKIVRAQAQFFF
ncbi:MAG: S-layer protein, partial [Firmicutes bacterium]|nr:S-layer protein [Bacillota bacterium]